MKRMCFLAFCVLAVTIFSCSKDAETEPTSKVTDFTKRAALSPDNPDYFEGEFEMKPVTVKLGAKSSSRSASAVSSTLSPSEVNVDLCNNTEVGIMASGEVSLPSVADVFFFFDLSGSMSSEINNVKSNVAAIYTQLYSQINDLQVGVGCGIENFNLAQDLTSSSTEFEAGLNTCGVLYGAAENYALHLNKMINDVNWRSGAAKTVIMFLDEGPQEYGSYSFDEELRNMKNAGIELILINSSYNNSVYNSWEAKKGIFNFEHVRINSDGSIPSGISISDLIINSIGQAYCELGTLEYKPIDPMYNDWVVSSPNDYSNINTCDQSTYNFDATYTAPDGTPTGDYSFEMGLFGDGVLYDSHTVNVQVCNEIEIPLDIHPTSCPNPLNTKSRGKMPAAILGMADFNVQDVDVSTITINGVSPIRHAYEDVSTPEMPLVGKPLDMYACNTYGPDGYEDLTLKFSTQAIVSTLTNPKKGDVFILTVEGYLNDGTPFKGEDVVKIAR